MRTKADIDFHGPEGHANTRMITTLLRLGLRKNTVRIVRTVRDQRAGAAPKHAVPDVSETAIPVPSAINCKRGCPVCASRGQILDQSHGVCA